MATEIERKFRVARTPEEGELGRGVHIRQGYLAEDNGVEVRIRITADTATLTVKAGSGIARTEVEAAVPVHEAEALWLHTAGRRVEKTRFRLPLGDGLTAELDRYAGALEGVTTVEVEFPSRAASEAFTPPEWFGAELTGRSEWSNASLSRHGAPHD